MPNELPSRPRLLLRRLHEVMAGAGSAEKRLNQVVRMIAQYMVTEVCSVYLARAGEVLELFATEGLKQEAVHKTKLRLGEGLVGMIAQRGVPLNVPEAAENPHFVYRPETGEEEYHSLLGVPIIRSGRVYGVVVLQNITPRHYTDEEVEALQTVAMVLAELLATGELVDPRELVEGTVNIGLPVVLDGQSLSEGIASGQAVLHEPRIEITNLVSDDTEAEQERLQGALQAMREQLDRMMASAELGTSGEHREILETYKMFAYDRGWQSRIHEAIESGLTAEAAVERVQQRHRVRMMETDDPYLRERLSDLDDLSYRLIRIITGDTGAEVRENLSRDSVIVARNMGPAELLDYDRGRLRAIVLSAGSPTAHVSIIARAMGIPVVGRLGDSISQIESGDTLIVDAEAGHVFLRPDEDVAESYAQTISMREAKAEEYAAERHLPAQTLDGTNVELLINAGLLVDLPHLDAVGADGIGLFRTEFQFMVGQSLPRIEAQRDLYRKVIEAAGDRPVIFRTLDIGGDKHVPFLPRDDEENPAMGWRAIRVALDRPVLLRYQLRALLDAAAGRELNLMFPLIAEIEELRAARRIVNKEVTRLERLGKEAPDRINIGAMFEVPALAWQLDQLMKEADFLSIGTNDLLQFFFACDRSNPRLIDRYDLLSPAVLSLIRQVVRAADSAGVPVSLCGEMGARPLEAMALIGLGLRRFSISPSRVGPIKSMVRSLNRKPIEDFIERGLGTVQHSLRESLWSFARDHGVRL